MWIMMCYDLVLLIKVVVMMMFVMCLVEVGLLEFDELVVIYLFEFMNVDIELWVFVGDFLVYLSGVFWWIDFYVCNGGFVLREVY